jgi:hypothetical protein
VAPDERTIAWWGEWEPGPFVQVVDVASGRELHREVCAALNVWAAGSGFFTLDQGWRPGGRRLGIRLVAMVRDGDRVDVSSSEVAGRTSLLGVAPTGDRLALFTDGRSELVTWPDRRLQMAWQGYSAGVDWDAGCVWALPSGGRRLQLAALDGSWTHELPVARSRHTVRSVGDGVLRTGFHGVRLFRPRGPVVTVLPPTSRTLWDVSVAGGGRSVRMVLGGKVRVFRVDLDEGRVLEAPADTLHLARSPRYLPWHPVWHPTSDLVALIRRWPRTAVWSATGGFVCRLPDGAIPHAWLADGARLLVSRAHGGTGHLELWSVA